jgi:outer membrane protein assembly factor BamB
MWAALIAFGSALAVAGCSGDLERTDKRQSAAGAAHAAEARDAGSRARGTDVLTYKNDAARTGQNLTESRLNPATVNPAGFGLQRMLQVDGKVDAQPLYVSQLDTGGGRHDTVFAATEHASVFAFDADTGSALWRASLLAADETPSDRRGCGQVSPEIGITSTPVIDRELGPRGTLFAVAMSRDKASHYHQRLHALDLATGSERPGSPVEIAVRAASTVADGFDPGRYEERAALLLSRGSLYTTWASHCDHAPYGGWIIAYDARTLTQSAVLDVAPRGGRGPAIWMSGGGPAADDEGAVYLLTANGAFDADFDAQGFPVPGDYGNSFLKLGLHGGLLSILDYFTLFNVRAESARDQDLGSGGVMLLPDLPDETGIVRHLVIGAGKDGNVYLVDRGFMGRFDPAKNRIWQEVDGVLPGGIRSTPAYFNGAVYYCDVGGTLKSFRLRNARLDAAGPHAQSQHRFGYPGSAPCVSANGDVDGIVWSFENGNPAVLHAFDASDLSHELYNSNEAAGGRDHFGAGNKFITPTVADGRVFLGTTGAVAVFGRLR